MKVRTLQAWFLMVVGAGILMYNLMGFEPAFTGPGGYGQQVARGKRYKTEQKIWGAVGASLLAAGFFIENRRRY